jgi:hypothetical protein
MQKLFALMLLVVGSSAVAMATPPLAIPEVDPASGASALALIAGGLLILRSCRKK